MTGSQDTDRPMLRVIAGGEPTGEEVAALVAALTLVTKRASVPALPVRSRWGSREAGLRRPLHPGPDAWRAASRTR